MRNKPRIRFKGFTEDWEQRKLGDFTNQINTFVNPEDAKLPLWSLTAEAGLIEKSDRYERDFLVKKKDQFKRIETNTLVYNPMNITIGSIDIYTGLYPIAVSGYYVSIVYDKNIDTDFLKEVLLLPSSLKMYKNYATGSLIERQRVQYPTFSKLQLLLPNLDEQKAIGQFFKSLNLDITLHQRKLEKLKLAKKALLQKLFPKNGSQFPEIRFKGFTDAWEQRKLLDIAKTFIGLVTTMTENYRDSGTLLIRNSDIKEGQFVFSENPIHLDEEFSKKNKTRRLQIGDVVTVHTGDIGTSAVIEEKEAGAIGFATINTRTDKSILNPYFLATYFNTEKHKCYANSVSTGDGRLNYNIKDFNKLVISVPTLDEQERISVLINDMNTIITLHQRKLERLQEVKKGLLQKMFV